MKNRDILISGASVAGPALAYWLHSYGFNPTIVERASAPRPGGQAVDIRGAARIAAERMGILNAVREAHTGARGMRIVNSQGKRLAGMDSDTFGDSGGIIAEIEILRGDLVRILNEATRDNVPYLFDDSITAMEETSDGIHVTFEHAAPRTFDLIIGADGLHSGVRGLAFGPESQFLRDLGCYVAIFSADLTRSLNGWEEFYNVPPGRTVGLYPVRQGTGAKAMFYFASPPLAFDRHDVEQQKRLLAQAFANVGWETPRLLDAMSHAPDFYFDRVGQIQMDSWSRGRVALLGDAGYCPSPMAGVGTSLAIVGAYVLAGELAASAGDYTAAFASYERQMRPYVAEGQKLEKGAHGFLLPTSHVQVWIRNQVLRVIAHLLKGKVDIGVQKAANAIALKDYSRFEQVASRSEVR